MRIIGFKQPSEPFLMVATSPKARVVGERGQGQDVQQETSRTITMAEQSTPTGDMMPVSPPPSEPLTVRPSTPRIAGSPQSTTPVRSVSRTPRRLDRGSDKQSPQELPGQLRDYNKPGLKEPAIDINEPRQTRSGRHYAGD